MRAEAQILGEHAVEEIGLVRRQAAAVLHEVLHEREGRDVGEREFAEEVVVAVEGRLKAVERLRAADPTGRHNTRYRGISYRERADGTRASSVYFKGRYIGVDGGEKEALAK